MRQTNKSPNHRISDAPIVFGQKIWAVVEAFWASVGHQADATPREALVHNGGVMSVFPEGGKTLLRTCERSKLHQQPCEAGCRSGPDIEAPKTPSSPAIRLGVDPPKTKPSTNRRPSTTMTTR